MVENMPSNKNLYMKPQSIKKVKFNKQRLITKLNEAEETEEDFQTYPNVQTV